MVLNPVPSRLGATAAMRVPLMPMSARTPGAAAAVDDEAVPDEDVVVHA